MCYHLNSTLPKRLDTLLPNHVITRRHPTGRTRTTTYTRENESLTLLTSHCLHVSYRNEAKGHRWELERILQTSQLDEQILMTNTMTTPYPTLQVVIIMAEQRTQSLSDELRGCAFPRLIHSKDMA